MQVLWTVFIRKNVLRPQVAAVSKALPAYRFCKVDAGCGVVSAAVVSFPAGGLVATQRFQSENNQLGIRILLQ